MEPDVAAITRMAAFLVRHGDRTVSTREHGTVRPRVRALVELLGHNPEGSWKRTDALLSDPGFGPDLPARITEFEADAATLASMHDAATLQALYRGLQALAAADGEVSAGEALIVDELAHIWKLSR